MDTVSQGSATESKQDHFNFKKAVALGLLCVVLVLVAVGYWIYSQRYVTTDDAYVNANVVQIASRVTGQVISLNVVNNQDVTQGQVLFQLDPEPFIVAIDQAKAQLLIDQANLVNAQVTAKRTFTLTAQGVLSQQDRDNALAKLDSAQAQVTLDQAALQNAQLNLQYATITAPTNGRISNLSLRPQDTVDANDSQFALIADSEYWIDANFEEGDLARIKIGAPAKIVVDMYPDHPFKGQVESISGASGNAFALLPPQNATGNWVKVTQRVPVRVRVTDVDVNYPLRVGTSATVTIPTHS